VEQSVVPVMHPPLNEHATPWVQDTHAPLSQTRFAPHAVPLPAFVPKSMHRAAPLEQSTEPRWQALDGVQTAPCVQALQVPLSSQTWFAPHGVPALTLSLRSTHVATPLEHNVAPRWHAFDGIQAAPTVQALQSPLPSQTWFTPHDVPGLAFDPVSTHVNRPVAHDVVPT
jgi:hypothetical protein